MRPEARRSAATTPWQRESKYIREPSYARGEGKQQKLIACGDGSRVMLFLSSISGMHSLVADGSSDLIVIHFDEKGCSIYNPRRFHHPGNAFVFNGQLYFEHAINHGANLLVWKWSGTNFFELKTDEA